MMDAGLSLPMDAIRQDYIRNLAVQHDDIARLSGGNDAGQDAYPGLRACAHKLAGTGKIYGFPEISEAGYSLETALRQPDVSADDVVRKAKYLLSVLERAMRSGEGRGGRGAAEGAPGGADAAAPAAVAPAAVAPAAAGPGDSPVADDPARDMGRPVLLVVDDDENITRLVRTLFEPIADVVVRCDVPGGLQAAHEMRPHLILLDEQMPGERSGLDLLQQLRDTPVTANVPVIMMSADDSLTSIMQALVSGATDYMIKPFDPARLMSKGSELLKTYRTRILIADDDEQVRNLLAYKLMAAGCQVVTAADGQEAWERLEKESFSLVLLDRTMPDLDGTVLLRMMHGDDATARIPVVFLTARRSAADIVDGLLTGATDYITKPFDPDEVVKRCLELVKAKRH